MDGGTDIVKRAADAGMSALGLIVLAPALVAIALSVKVSSPGPIFFFQERVGRNGKKFKLIKFRTMTHEPGRAGLGITARGDPRITPVGRILRKYKLDELPQLLNVLRGDMSIVGPRPELEKYVEQFASDYRDILRVRPGLTDPAALAFRDEEQVLASFADPERAYVETVLPRKLQLSRDYAAKAGLRSDVKVIALTAWLITFGRESTTRER